MDARPQTRLSNCPTTPPAAAIGVRADEVLTRRGLMVRLGWGRKQWTAAQRAGLKSVLSGRERIIIGKWVIELLEKLWEDQASAELEARQNGAGKQEAQGDG